MTFGNFIQTSQIGKEFKRDLVNIHVLIGFFLADIFKDKKLNILFKALVTILSAISDNKYLQKC